MTAPDGDDYTWSGSPLERAVFNTVAAARRFGLKDTTGEMDTDSLETWREEIQTLEARQYRRVNAPDLRTPDQVERDDVQRLEQRIAALEAAVFGPINGDC